MCLCQAYSTPLAQATIIYVIHSRFNLCLLQLVYSGACASGAHPQHAISGLLIHCAADGLAMGAAALSGNASLTALVGAAMVLHKAAMALGLSTYLMSCHWSWARSQRTLIIFSATAPVSAVTTYMLLGAVPLFTTPTAVALILLVSGGTFLYAATMHILPEVLAAGGGGMSREQLIAVSVGCLAPVVLSWGHSH
jgi:zinc transporter 9